MEIADSFVPTAGVVGILPMVTYFFFVVAVYVFLGSFVAALASPAASRQRSLLILTAVMAVVSGLSYYQIQGYYHNMLAELVAVTDPGNRQVLIRESYNAIGQYRFMDWAITIPLLLIQAVLIRRNDFILSGRVLFSVLAASFFMILTGYIGHQQLGFDNEILVGPKAIWGVVSMLGYAALVWILLPFWKQTVIKTWPDDQRISKLTTLSVGVLGFAYPLGYFISLTNIDSNFIHIAYTLADMISLLVMGFAAYITQKAEAIKSST